MGLRFPLERKMKKLLPLFIILVLITPLFADDSSEPPKKSLEEQRRETLRFGTDTEISSLIQTLITEKIDYLDNELKELAQKTRNRIILSGIFSFFNEMEKKGLEERAIRAITDRDLEANETVMAAVNYLGKVKAAAAVDCLRELINSGESRFLNTAIKALGRTGSSKEVIVSVYKPAESAAGLRPVPGYEPVGQPGERYPTDDNELAESENPPEDLNDPLAESQIQPAATGIEPAKTETPHVEPEIPLVESKISLADNTAAFLLDYYDDNTLEDETRREIVIALGETGSKEGVSFLVELVRNNEERATLRMVALDAISKIGDEEGLDAVIGAVSSTDPNIRSSAIAALAPFSGEEVDDAILEAFRDSYYRTRIGAAAAAGKRRLESAVPYLRYRAENDDVPAVKDEAIKALGAINNGEAMAILDSLFTERKNSDRVRILAADMLLQNNADTYGSRVFSEMDEAKLKNQTPLYNGFVRVMGSAKSGTMEGLARRFISAGGVIEKSLALDLIVNNEFRSLAEEVRSLLDEKAYGASIARKAQSTLDKLGL